MELLRRLAGQYLKAKKFERVKNNRLIKLSRSRPYKKNDNAHVEQKGGDKVRKLIGYWRFDTPEEVRLLIYDLTRVEI